MEKVEVKFLNDDGEEKTAVLFGLAEAFAFVGVLLAEGIKNFTFGVLP